MEKKTGECREEGKTTVYGKFTGCVQPWALKWRRIRWASRVAGRWKSINSSTMEASGRQRHK